MRVWLVERDVGGYEYVLFEVFENQQAAEAYLDLLCEKWDAPDEITVREIEPLRESPTQEFDPLMWGTLGENPRRPVEEA